MLHFPQLLDYVSLHVYRTSHRWEFMTEGGDIGFRVYYKDPEEGVVDLVPLDRIESHLVIEEGEIICNKTGKCNTFFYKS